jgi:Putative prokaryotic signal transducing protein
MADRARSDDSDDNTIPRAASPDVVNDELVEVFDTQEESEALVIKGLLESSGIDALVSSLDTQQGLFPGVGKMIVRVRRDQAEDAQRIIEESRSPGLAEEAEAAGETGSATAEDSNAPSSANARLKPLA